MRKLLLTLAAAVVASTPAWAVKLTGNIEGVGTATANPPEGTITEIPNAITLTYANDAIWPQYGEGNMPQAIDPNTVVDNTVTITRDGEALESIVGVGVPDARTIKINFINGPWTEPGTYVVTIVPGEYYSNISYVGNYSNDMPVGATWTYTIPDITVDMAGTVQAWAGEGDETTIYAAGDARSVEVKYGHGLASLTIPDMGCLPHADVATTTAYDLALTGITVNEVTETEGTETVTKQVLSGTGTVTDEESAFHGEQFTVSGSFYTQYGNVRACINLVAADGDNIRFVTSQADLKKFLTSKTVSGLANFWTNRLVTATYYGNNKAITSGNAVPLNTDSPATLSYEAELNGGGLASCTFSGLEVEWNGAMVSLGEVAFTGLNQYSLNNGAHTTINVADLGGDCDVELKGRLEESEVNLFLTFTIDAGALYAQFRRGDDVEAAPLPELVNATYDVDGSTDGTVVNVSFVNQRGQAFGDLYVTNSKCTVTSTPALDADVACVVKKVNSTSLQVVFTKGTEAYTLDPNVRYEFQVAFDHDDTNRTPPQLRNYLFGTGTTVNYIYIPTLEFAVANGVLTGVEGVMGANGEAIYYDLMGRVVAHPAQGVFIRVQGGKAQKVLL